MDDKADKLKSYINEISLIAEKEPFNYTALKKCFDSYQLTESDLGRLKKVAASHIKRSEELLQNRRIEEALMSMERAVEIHPLSDEYRNRMAQLYMIKAREEGQDGRYRELAMKNATFSRLISSANPIAENIIKEIRIKEKSLSGTVSYKKILLPFAGLLVLITASFLTQNRFSFPFFQQESSKDKTQMTVPYIKQTETFRERKLDTVLNGLPEDCRVDIFQSKLNLTNGSISCTIQGELRNESRAIKSADLEIALKNYDGVTLFSRIFPLVSEDQWLMPGEPALIDEFFFVHYLPPEIDEVRISFKNLIIADEIPRQEEKKPLTLEWTASRPEGVSIELFQLDSSGFDGYGEEYINFKFRLDNRGTVPINRFQVDLKWRDTFGEELFSTNRDLIKEENPALLPEGTRIFRVFTSLPSGLEDKKPEFYINVTRINS
ncbi:MAG: hypothetical protein JXR86_08405 [Spirochaetales bacterium]|nr:hypothetical protein [Spirochaetales bacterium]